MRKNIWWLGLIVFGVADWASTVILMERYGVTERNPIASWVWSVTGIWGMFLWKLVTSGIGIGIFLLLLKRGDRSVRRLVYGLIAMCYGGCLWIAVLHVEWWIFINSA